MHAYEQLKRLYEKNHKHCLEEDLLIFSSGGYVHITPQYAILASHWEGMRAWYVHAAVGHGALSKFFELAPFELPHVAFARPLRGRWQVKYYNFQRIKRLCMLSKQ